MNKQSKKVKLCVILHPALKNNQAYLLHMEITKSHLNNYLSALWSENKYNDPLLLLHF